MTTILIVDDEPLVRRTLQRALTRAGYRVVVATHGEEAVALVRGGLRPDLLVSDVQIDDLDGPRVAEAVHAVLPELPVIFMSGETPENLPGYGVDRERHTFLPKPFQPSELLACVERLVGGGAPV